MDDFLILLQAKLDEARSKGNINSDIDKLQSKIEKLKVQAEIDPNSVKNIAQQLSKIMNQKVVVDNIQIDTRQTVKAGEQLGQNLGNSLNKNLTSSLNSVKQNIDNVIKGFSNQKLNSYDLSKMFNLNRVNIDNSVIQQVRSLTNELNSLAKEALKTNSDSSWEGIVNKISSLSQVLNKFGAGRDLTSFKESLDVLDYFQNKKIFIGNKSEALSNAGMNVKELNNQFRNLGVTFTTVSEGSTKLDTVWTELFNISPNLQNFNTFGDQINAIVEHLKIAKEAMYGDSNLQPLNGKEVNKVLLDWLSNLENASKKLTVFREEQTEIEQQIAQASTSATNTIIQNEEKKQQVIRQTANIQRKISESESLIKSGANVTTFEHTNNAAREASEYFKQLLQDENAVISVSERFGELNGLTSFTVNVKRATGEVESLRYSLEEIKDANGNGTGDFLFTNKGGELNNANAIKQIQAIENAFADYTAKLAQFKSTNSEILSGLSTPISDFESKLAGLKNGTSTISEVANSFKSLNTEASNITANFSRQLSPIDSAIRNLAKGEETIASLRAEIKGLNNAPKEINTELNKCSSLLAKVKQIESENGRTSEWSQAYKEWANVVDALKAKLTTLRKEQSNVASTQIFKISDLKSNDIAYMSKVYNTIEKQMSEINKMANAKGWNIVDVSGVEQADGKIKQLTLTVQDAEGALKRLTMQREKLQGNGKAQFGLMQVGDVKVIETAAQAQEKLAQNAEKANAKLAEQANKIQLSMTDKSAPKDNYDLQIKKLTDQLSNLGLTNEEVAQKIRVLTEAQAELKKVIDSTNYNSINEKNQAILSADEKRSTALNQVKNAYEDAKLAYDKYMQPVSSEKATSLINKINSFLTKNTKITNDAKVALQGYTDELSRGVNLSRWNEINGVLKKTENSMRGLGRLGASLKDQMSQAAQSFTQWLSVSSVIMLIVSKTRNAISELKEINTLLTEISKANDKLSKSDLNKIGNNSFDIASKYGKNATDYLSGVQEASRAGYENAEAIAELSVATQGAGDMTDELANKYIIATDKAYKLGGSVEKLTEVLDGSNYITNHNAVNMTELAEAMSIVGSTAASFGVEANETTAVLGTMIATTQQSGSEMARAFRAILLNIRQVSDEEEGIDAEGLTKYEKACNALGVSLKETKDGILQTRDAMEVLRDLSVEYNQLEENDLRRTDLLNSVGGKLRANALDAILKNFDMYSKMLDEYAQGTGSMAVEAEKTANSWEGSMNRLGNTWKDTVENIADSDAIITIINGLNSLLSVVNNVTDKLGSLGTIGISGLGAGIAKFVKSFD